MYRTKTGEEIFIIDGHTYLYTGNYDVVALRKQMIVVDRLPFPGGIATVSPSQPVTK